MAKKLHVAYDANGSIISASDSTPNLPLPTHMKGVTKGEFDIPSKFEHQKPREYIHSLAVDVKGRQLKEK